MNNSLTILLISFLFFSKNILSPTILGKWKTIDDETGKERSIVEIYEKNGKYYGKVIDILDPTVKYKKCELCKGENKNKPIIGMVVISGLEKVGNEYTNGHITDPKNGKVYKCKIEYSEANRIIVRGYIGISLFGRSQTWIRIK
jgi:uncharacterized protein (DUF2147 family)